MSEYKNPYPTVDIIIEIDNKIVLIERKNKPYGFALPGGFIDYGESSETAAVREAKEETNLDIKIKELLGVYSNPDRDPRFHTISTVYIAAAKGHLKAGDDAKNAVLINPYKDLENKVLSFDHKKIIEDYINKKRLEINEECRDFFSTLPFTAFIMDIKCNILFYNNNYSKMIEKDIFAKIEFKEWVLKHIKNRNFRYNGYRIIDKVFDIYFFNIAEELYGCFMVDITDQTVLADELASVYIQSEIMQIEISKKLFEIKSLYELSRDMMKFRNLNEFCKGISDKLKETFNFDFIAIYSLSDNIYKLKYKTDDKDIPEIFNQKIPVSILTQILKKEIILPILDKDKTRLILLIQKKDIFKEEELKTLLTFSSTIALGINNLLLYIDLRDHSTAIEFLNRELKNTVEKLESSNSVKSEFVQTVSHELRTPLTSIKSYTETLLSMKDEYDKEVFCEFLNIIQTETNRLTRIINSLLDISRIESKRLEIRIKRLNIIDIINRVINTYENLAAENNIEIKNEIQLKVIFISGDEDRVVQILTNLISNAIKYNKPGGQVNIKAKILDKKVHIDIIDTGIGIPFDEKENIFESFTRVETGLYNENESTGLGLTITKKLVELHGGEIKVNSEEGKGSCFTVILPLLSD